MTTEPRIERGAAAEGPGGLTLPPVWLRRLGTSAWLVVGIVPLTVAAVTLLALTQTIVMPVVAAGVIAAVASRGGGLARASLCRPSVRRGRADPGRAADVGGHTDRGRPVGGPPRQPEGVGA